jgi:hypothetical protein
MRCHCFASAHLFSCQLVVARRLLPLAQARLLAACRRQQLRVFPHYLSKWNRRLKRSIRARQDGSKIRKNEHPLDEVVFSMTSNGQDMIISVSNYSSTEEASSAFKTLSAPDSRSTLAPESVTHFGQQAATVALGHAPSTVQDVYIRGTGDYAGIDNEYIQYDQLLIAINMVPAQT